MDDDDAEVWNAWAAPDSTTLADAVRDAEPTKPAPKRDNGDKARRKLDAEQVYTNRKPPRRCSETAQRRPWHG